MHAELTGLSILRTAMLIYISSMLPFIAARGAVILAAALQVPWYFAFFLTSAGSVTVAALLLRIDRSTLEKLRRYKIFNTFFDAVDRQLQKHHDIIGKRAYRWLAMMISIPFTGVGVSAACVTAKLLDLEYDHALMAVFAGVLISGFLTTAGVYGMLTGVRTLLEAVL